MLSLYRHKRFCHFTENSLIGRDGSSSGMTRFYCHLCPYTSNYKHNVLAHVRRHSGERPHKCTECQKGFVTKTELRVHFRIHSGEKPYRCEFCPETFSRKMHLDVHKGMHFKWKLILVWKKSMIVLLQSNFIFLPLLYIGLIL